MYSVLTAGSIRSLELATRLAVVYGNAEVRAAHLLWALVLQETRASELLTAHGVDVERLSQLYAPPAEGFDTQLVAEISQGHVETTAGLSAETARQPLVVSVLQIIRQQISSELLNGEIATEHLLYGLLAADPAVASEFRRFGLTLERLGSQVDGLVPQDLSAEASVTLKFREGGESVDHDTLRVLDAAANRAREGLRVLEDYVRFVLDDAHLSRRLKTWRHELSHALSRIATHHLLAARETEQDVGTQIHTLTEARRESLTAVVQANFKRVEEAARTLEEFGKVLAPSIGEQIGQLRYQIYTLEKAVLQTHFARERLQGRHLYLLLTEELCHHGSGPAVRGAMQGGVGIVQLREKRMADRELVAMGRRVREWTREAGALLIINDRPDLAVLTEADGVHVGQEELSVKDARRIVGPDKLVGVSTHTIEQARQAVLDGADYIGVGPVFPTTTKSFSEFAGLEFVRQVAAEITLPFFAIGGIKLDNVDQVLEAGANGIAVSGALCGAADPAEVASEFQSRLRNRQTVKFAVPGEPWSIERDAGV